MTLSELNNVLDVCVGRSIKKSVFCHLVWSYKLSEVEFESLTVKLMSLSPSVRQLWRMGGKSTPQKKAEVKKQQVEKT